MRRVVVFDLDKTLSCCNVSFAFGRFLYKRKRFSHFTACAIAWIYFLHTQGLSSINSVHTTAFRLLFYRQEHGQVEELVRKFLESEGKSLFRPSILKELEEAKRRGDEVWLQSSSPDFIVKEISDILQIERVSASCYEVDSEGRFSSLQTVVTGEIKKNLVEKFLQTNHLSWHEVIAYSDSYLDLPLLERVGQAITVCPDRKLKKIAKERNWQIIDG